MSIIGFLTGFDRKHRRNTQAIHAHLTALGTEADSTVKEISQATGVHPLDVLAVLSQLHVESRVTFGPQREVTEVRSTWKITNPENTDA